MKYAYYPGCSLTESAREYDVSTRMVMESLGVEITDIPDWTCCGASAVESVSKLLTYSLPARNLALAEKELSGQHILVPCSACYLNLYRVSRETGKNKDLASDIQEVLDTESLAYQGKAKVKHLLDVLANDIGPEKIKANVDIPLSGLTVAPYYGCQILRPYHQFDDPEQPVSMEPVLESLGAKIHPWNWGGKCCGASLMATKKDIALKLVGSILRGASGADVIVTVCPMCQMNLEAYQKQAMKRHGNQSPVSVLYLPQLMGLAFGFSEDQVLLNKNMVITDKFRSALKSPPPEEVGA